MLNDLRGAGPPPRQRGLPAGSQSPVEKSPSMYSGVWVSRACTTLHRAKTEVESLISEDSLSSHHAVSRQRSSETCLCPKLLLSNCPCRFETADGRRSLSRGARAHQAIPTLEMTCMAAWRRGKSNDFQWKNRRANGGLATERTDAGQEAISTMGSPWRAFDREFVCRCRIFLETLPTSCLTFFFFALFAWDLQPLRGARLMVATLIIADLDHAQVIERVCASTPQRAAVGCGGGTDAD